MRRSINNLFARLIFLTLLALAGFTGAMASAPVSMETAGLEFACGDLTLPPYWQDGAVYHRRDATQYTNSVSDSAYLAGATFWRWNMFVDTARDKHTVKWGTFEIDVDAYNATWAGYFRAEGTWERLAPYPTLNIELTGWGTGDFQGMTVSGVGTTVDVTDHPANSCGEAEGTGIKYAIVFEH